MSDTFDPRRTADVRPDAAGSHWHDSLASRMPGTERVRLDRLAALAAAQLEVTHCQIALVDDNLRVVGGAGLDDDTQDAVIPTEQSLCSLVRASEAPVRIADTAADPRTRNLPPVVAGDAGCYLGVPLQAGDGVVIGTLCVFDAGIREWTDSEQSMLVALSDSVVAELELTMLSTQYQVDRALWQVSMEAGGIGTYDLDVRSGALEWDDRMVELFGYTRETYDNSLSDAYERLHPDDLPRVSAYVERAIAEGGEYRDEYRVLLPDGGVRWLVAQGRVLTAADGTADRLVGAAYDTTLARETNERLEAILGGMSLGYARMDRDWQINYVNREAAAILRRPSEDLVGRSLWAEFPAMAGTVYETNYRRVLQTGRPETFEAYYPAPLGLWLEIRAVVEGEGLGLYFQNVSERVTARHRAEQVTQRAELLARLNLDLARGADEDEALSRIPEIIVPTLCDWAIVTVIDTSLSEQGSSASPEAAVRGLRDVASDHVGPDRRDLLRRFVTARMAAFEELPTMPAITLRAAAGGDTTVLRSRATELTLPNLPPGESRVLLAELAPEAVAVVPLRARGRTLALITLGWDAVSVSLDPLTPVVAVGPTDDDLVTLSLIADRAGVALDNARLARERRTLAESLQRSLLTEPPDIADLEIEVRYLPAAASVQVGGDWYDAFVRDDGAVDVVIGDVLGHDSQAAAVMGQIRTLLRSSSVITANGPAGVLQTVDSALRTLRVGTSATAVVARLERSGQHGFRLTWSNAGHPPPLFIGPDGTVEILEAARPNMLLGVDPTSRRDEHQRDLPEGATLLMFTDGLVERRDRPFDEGIAQLAALLGELGRLPLGELCDVVIDQLGLLPRTDDVAVIAVRAGARPD